MYKPDNKDEKSRNDDDPIVGDGATNFDDSIDGDGGGRRRWRRMLKTKR